MPYPARLDFFKRVGCVRVCADTRHRSLRTRTRARVLVLRSLSKLARVSGDVVYEARWRGGRVEGGRVVGGGWRVVGGWLEGWREGGL